MKKIYLKLYLFICLISANVVHAEDDLPSTSNYCSSELGDLVSLVKLFLTLIKIIVPVGIIIMGCFDYFKATTSSDPDKELAKSSKIFINRIIAGVMVFLVFSIVTFAIDIVARNNNENSEWLSCWTNYETATQED